MAKPKYGIIKAKFPQRDLLRVPHRKGVLTVAYPAFGPDYFKNNIEEMQKDYSHPQTGKRISFTEPTTSKSISAAAYDFENMAKPKIFNPHWLQTGYIVRASEFVVVNPPKDAQGNPIIDEQTLKSYLNKSIKVNGIYLGENDFGFAPCETFERGVQDSGKFAEGGLARILEHTREKIAKNLKVISSLKNYPKGVDVLGFDQGKKPILTVVNLYTSRHFGFGGSRLNVSIGERYNYEGLAFGLLKDGEDVAPEK